MAHEQTIRAAAIALGSSIMWQPDGAIIGTDLVVKQVSENEAKHLGSQWLWTSCPPSKRLIADALVDMLNKKLVVELMDFSVSRVYVKTDDCSYAYYLDSGRNLTCEKLI